MLCIFFHRLIALIRTRPKGIPDKDLSNEMPDLKPRQRAEIINKFLSQGHVELLNKQGVLFYRFKDPTELVKGSTNEEKIVHEIIEEAGNEGIGIGDIRKKTNLINAQLQKVLKNLEAKRFIKAVKSVTSNKKMYMLYHLEPDTSITGNVWYQDKEIETEFVDVLSQQCYQFLEQKRQKMKSCNVGPIVARKTMFASAEEVWKFISDSGISKVTFFNIKAMFSYCSKAFAFKFKKINMYAGEIICKGYRNDFEYLGVRR